MIQYLSPIFTALIGVFVLREMVPARQWLFYEVAFTGVFVLKGFDARVSTRRSITKAENDPQPSTRLASRNGKEPAHEARDAMDYTFVVILVLVPVCSYSRLYTSTKPTPVPPSTPTATTV